MAKKSLKLPENDLEQLYQRGIEGNRVNATPHKVYRLCINPIGIYGIFVPRKFEVIKF